MHTIIQVVDGRVLGQVITLPKPLQDVKVRITIAPIVETKTQQLPRSVLRSRLKGSHTAALTGVLKQAANVDFKELQAERRATKYERPH